jgi:hypothetical protein
MSIRNFVIKINDTLSETHSISCGVPQGAVLSLTLFSIYINDSPKRDSKNLEQTRLFADDTMYSIMYKKQTQQFKNRIRELEEWSFKWRVTLAQKKCY